MAKTDSLTKDEIIREFETMKSIELSAHEVYQDIATDRTLGPEKVKTVFKSLAADEQRHADLVQEIIDIVSNAL
jgi:rubrerythrin